VELANISADYTVNVEAQVQEIDFDRGTESDEIIIL